MTDILYRCELHDVDHGRNVVRDGLLPAIGSQLRQGRHLVVKVEEWEEDLTEEQRGYYHTGVLGFIAEHATANGQKFPMPVWKEFFRAKFLGSRRKKYRDPMTGRHVWRTERVSTESLGVKGYGNLIDQVTAFAATELGLTVPPPRRPKKPATREVIDSDGVIHTEEVAA